MLVPTQQENPDGFHMRYHVTKLDGECDPRAFYFVLRLDEFGDDPQWILACRAAMRTLVLELSAAKHLQQVAADLERCLDNLVPVGPAPDSTSPT